MKISTNFSGGNIIVHRQEGNTFFVERDIRDTIGDWFYWAFCVEGAEGQTLTFDFCGHNRIGYYGPAVSHDLKHWQWLNNGDSQTRFSYTFAAGEEKVYFAHDMVYSPSMFSDFCRIEGIEIKTFCYTKKGRPVPYISFGTGDKTILMAARHHCCESTGNYVLQGAIESLHNELPDGYKVICVPFVDLDGVIDGDQGKNRAPFDHNRDYGEQEAIYASTAKIRELEKAENIVYAFDFHAPDHCGGCHDTVYIPRKQHVDRVMTFSRLFEKSITANSMKYKRYNDIDPGWEWNSISSPCFGNYWWDKGAELSFTVETTYFGPSDNVFSQDRAVELGHCFATALHQYIKQKMLDTKNIKLTFTGDVLCTSTILNRCQDNFDPLFEQNSNELRGSDFTVCNLETPVAGEALGFTNDRYCFNTPVTYAHSLKKAGADLVCLANNHCMDRGILGIKKTLDNLDSICLTHIGIYRDELEKGTIFVRDIKGIKIAILNYTYGTNCQYHHTSIPTDADVRINLLQPEETSPGSVDLLASPEAIEADVERFYNTNSPHYSNYIRPYIDRLKEDITRAKQLADFVILVMHSGGQYNPLPDAYTKQLVETARSFGVDFIVGHHPHIIQPCDIQENYPTIFSLGNYMFAPSEVTGKPVDPSYNILLNLYLERRGEEVKIEKIGFKLLKVIESAGTAPYVADTYKLYMENPTPELHDDIMHYVNLFLNGKVYSEVADEYFF